MAIARAADLRGDTLGHFVCFPLRARLCEMEWLEVSQSVGSVSRARPFHPHARDDLLGPVATTASSKSTPFLPLLHQRQFGPPFRLRR